MPKINWFDNTEDQPRWEPRPRPGRVRRDPRDRRARLEQLIATAILPATAPEPPARRPLHLIWGAPMERPATDPEIRSD